MTRTNRSSLAAEGADLYGLSGSELPKKLGPKPFQSYDAAVPGITHVLVSKTHGNFHAENVNNGILRTSISEWGSKPSTSFDPAYVTGSLAARNLAGPKTPNSALNS